MKYLNIWINKSIRHFKEKLYIQCNMATDENKWINNCGPSQKNPPQLGRETKNSFEIEVRHREKKSTDFVYAEVKKKFAFEKNFF